MTRKLAGSRCELNQNDNLFPAALRAIPRPPERLFVVGNPSALQEGLAIIGARKATPYGISCAREFAALAASKGVPIISGGARGCDSAAHKAALDMYGTTVVFLGGGCDEIYPAEHYRLFQDVVDTGGAVVSEHPWNFAPLPYTFRDRNRLIAGLSKAVLIVEAGLPSGTFSTADEAIDAGKEVLVVPGAITSATSQGANRLLYQGATPVVDKESFEDALVRIFGALWYVKGEFFDKRPENCVALCEKGIKTCNEGSKYCAGGSRGYKDGDGGYRDGGGGYRDEGTICDDGGKGSDDGGRSCNDGGKNCENRGRVCEDGGRSCDEASEKNLIAAIRAEPMCLDDLYTLAQKIRGTREYQSWLHVTLAHAEAKGLIARHRDGKWGPCLHL